MRIKMPAMRATIGVIWATVSVMGLSWLRVSKLQEVAVVPIRSAVSVSLYAVPSGARSHQLFGVIIREGG
jgi:hypothetical protein